MKTVKEQRNGEGLSKRKQKKIAFARRRSLTQAEGKSNLEFNWRSRMGHDELSSTQGTVNQPRPKIDAVKVDLGNEQSESKPSPRNGRRRRRSKIKLKEEKDKSDTVNARFRAARARRSSDPGPQITRAIDSKPWRRASLPTIDWKIALVEAIRKAQEEEVHIPPSVLRQIYANRV